MKERKGSQEVDKVIDFFDQAVEKPTRPVNRWQPRLVFLFSGHMIDRPGRTESRFPANEECTDIAAKAISLKLDELGAGSKDLALCGGACGGDLLFAEECVKRCLRLEVRIPFDEPTFLKKSVNFAGDSWRNRFLEVKNHPNTNLYIMPNELGNTLKRTNPYERNNLWNLYTALSLEAEKVHFISLWNGQKGDGPGGTEHMGSEVLKHFGHVHILDTNQLFFKGTKP